nr:MAG TPA: hypothetical protein [Caudoviricetes sp.]DAY38194.1 MAG TPA: hypothetical protein [Caudoviricetes sp.]
MFYIIFYSSHLTGSNLNFILSDDLLYLKSF